MNKNNNNPIYGGLNLKEATRLHYLTNKKEKTEAEKREVKTIGEKRSEYIRGLYWVYGVRYLPIPNFK